MPDARTPKTELSSFRPPIRWSLSLTDGSRLPDLTFCVLHTPQVLNLLEEQIKRAAAPIDALMMVGGFSESHYLFKRVEARFKGRIAVIARPNDADTATSRGAAQVSSGCQLLSLSNYCFCSAWLCLRTTLTFKWGPL